MPTSNPIGCEHGGLHRDRPEHLPAPEAQGLEHREIARAPANHGHERVSHAEHADEREHCAEDPGHCVELIEPRHFERDGRGPRATEVAGELGDSRAGGGHVGAGLPPHQRSPPTRGRPGR